MNSNGHNKSDNSVSYVLKQDEFNIKSLKDNIGKFYNITLTQHEAKRLNGLNVRIERNDYRITKFFPFSASSTVDETLRQAIECRNEHYKKAGYPPFLEKGSLPTVEPCDVSDTGWSGIRIREKRDKRRNNSRLHVSFACPVPEQGKVTTKDISIKKFGGDIDKAIEEAVKLKRVKTDQFNKVVPIFNDLVTKSIEAACLTEHRTLNPTLQYIKNNVQRMWDQAYKMADID